MFVLRSKDLKILMKPDVTTDAIDAPNKLHLHIKYELPQTVSNKYQPLPFLTLASAQ